jgi:hypothetical protein
MGIKKCRSATKFEKVKILPPTADIAQLDAMRSSKKEPFIRRGKKESGLPEMKLVFPALLNKGKPYEQEVSFMLHAPNLAQPFAEAVLRKAGTAPKVKSLESHVMRLRPLFLFLLDTSQERIRLNDMSKVLLERYMNWMDAAKKDGKTRWGETTRQSNYGILAELLRDVKKTKQGKESFPANFHIPQGHWQGANRRIKSADVISRDLMTRIRLTCIAEVKQIIERFNETRLLCERFNGKLVPLEDLPPMKTGPRRLGEEDRWSRELIIAYMDQISCGGPVPTGCEIRKRYGASLTRALARHNLSIAYDIAPCFHATSRTIVPFVLLMAIAFAYNPDTIRKSTLKDFGYSDVLGKFFVANAYKGRAGAEQPVYLPVDEEIDNPSVLFQFLLQWTERLRPVADSSWANNLFIFAAWHDLTVSAFNAATKSICGWRGALNSFRKENGLEYFTLDMIRPTVLDLVYEIFDGDIKAVQTQAVHKRSDTTDIYTSSGERGRQYERLGRIMEQRERHRETNSLIDQRDRQEEEDLNSATPGWSCLDPYDSPYSTKNKLCAKYGWCPICPLGTINLNSPLSFAYCIGLRDAINRAQASMSPETWLQRLGPIKKKLDEHWLPSFDQIVINEAKKLHIPLMPIPE